MLHQDLQAGKTGFKSGCYVTSKHSVPKHIYECMLLTPQFLHQDLQAGKTGFKWITKFNIGCYVTSKCSVPKHIYD